MAWLTLLFIVILTTISKVTSLHCSDQQLPASVLQQVTTLKYCLVDDCTIKRIDTGKKLEIVYTTDSFIVTSPTDGHTSVIIAKLEKELPCAKPAINYHFILVELFSILTVAISGYIAVVHMLFKELRNLFGKLLMLYSITVACTFAAFVAMQVLRYQVAYNSQRLCYVTILLFMLASVSLEVFATCIIDHILYAMHSTYKLKPAMSKEKSKHHFRTYMIYELITMVTVMVLIITYDVATDNYKETILPDGHCILHLYDVQIYDTFQIVAISTTINKVIQVVQYVAYLYYKHQVSKVLKDAAIHSSQQQDFFHRITIALGGTVGLSFFVFLIQPILRLKAPIVYVSISVIFLMQQSMIMGVLMFTDTINQLYRECLSKE